MTRKLRVRRVGGSVGVTLPKELTTRLSLSPGDRVLAIETERGILPTPYDPTVERALAFAAHAARRYRNALRELAR